jgi:hypothetical protein
MCRTTAAGAALTPGTEPVTTYPIRLAIAMAVLVAGGVACSQPARGTSAQPAHAAAGGDGPSESATMICQPEATGEVAIALGVKTTTQPTASWVDHVYSCRYVYPDGVMVLSVKELPDEAATTAYVSAAQHGLPSYTAVRVLGQDGFAGPDGSLYVRKDFKVLQVDVSALPETVGQPARSRANAAFIVAAVIMTCWTGS